MAQTGVKNQQIFRDLKYETHKSNYYTLKDELKIEGHDHFHEPTFRESNTEGKKFRI